MKKIFVLTIAIFSLVLLPFGLTTVTAVTPTPQVFTFFSPQNHVTYYTDEVDIIYSINSGVRYSYFVLDGSSEYRENWKRFEGNITLTGLSEGAHNVSILMRSDNYYLSPGYVRATVFFKVDLTNPEPSPSPTIPEYSLIIVPIILITPVFWIVLRKKNLGAVLP